MGSTGSKNCESGMQITAKASKFDLDFRGLELDLRGSTLTLGGSETDEILRLVSPTFFLLL